MPNTQDSIFDSTTTEEQRNDNTANGQDFENLIEKAKLS